MNDNNDNILAQIQELRAEAGKNLQGNEYFAVACKLDALLAGGDSGGSEGRAALETIRSRLFSHNGAAAAPAAQDKAERQTLAEIRALHKEAVETLGGNAYFTLAQKLSAVVAAGDLDAADAQAGLQAIRAELIAASTAPKAAHNEIVESIIALRAKAGEKLQGNAYFDIAHGLDALLASNEPGVVSSGTALEEIRSLIESKQPAAPAQPATATALQQASETKADAETDAEAGTTIQFPKANSFSSPQATVAVRLSTEEEESAAAETIAETHPGQDDTSADEEPKSGFDALTEASWRRVREVAASDEIPVQHVNGSAANGMPVAQPVAAGDAEEAPAETEADASEVAAVAPEATAGAVETSEEIRAEMAETPAPAKEEEGAPVEITAFGTASPEVSEIAPEEGTAPAGIQAQETFKVSPRPHVINRPVKKERFARLKRLAKLPYLPKRKG